MPPFTVNDLELFYETIGDPNDPPILLVAGLGVQMIDWPSHFIDPLVQAGHYVIRFDNRDVGFSSTFDHGAHDPQVVVDALLDGRDPGVAYTLADMACDAAALLDALGIPAAHVIGVSMGGMIAQTLAIMFPAKVRSLTSIMSTTGAADVGQPTAEALAAILAPSAVTERDQFIARSIENARIWASPGLFDPNRMRELFEASWDRVGGPQAVNSGRHVCAIVSSPPRDQELQLVTAPTLVVHGTADTLITPTGGERTAASIPGATLLLVEGMGHDVGPTFAPRIVKAITELVADAAAA